MMQRQGETIGDIRRFNKSMYSFDWSKTKKDPSVLALIFSNLLTLTLALIFSWDIFIILIIYVVQSLIIGFFTFVRILTLSNYSTAGFLINGKKPASSFGVKIFTAIFFAFHYGMFHTVYLFFIMFFMVAFSFGANPINLPNISELVVFGFPVLVSFVLFFISHGISFLFFRDKQKQENIGTIMFSPYYRIIPMHLTIIFGFVLLVIHPILMLVLFLLIKTIVDVVMHILEHKEQYMTYL